MTETKKLQDALERLADFNDKEFKELNTGKSAVIAIDYSLHSQSIITIGTQHIGEVEATKIKEGIVSCFSDYLKHTPKTKQLAMVEGFMGEPVCMDNIDTSFAIGEPLGTTFIAKNAGIRVVSPEPRMKEQIAYLMSKGFGKYQIMLHFIIRQMPRMIDAHRINEQIFLYMQQLATLMADKKEGSKIDEGYLMASTIPKLNVAMKSIRGKNLFNLKNRLMYSNFTSRELYPLTNPMVPVIDKKNSTIINEIAYQLTDFRDRNLVREIWNATESGKSPFVVYGRSHIARIKPALACLYGEPRKIEM